MPPTFAVAQSLQPWSDMLSVRTGTSALAATLLAGVIAPGVAMAEPGRIPPIPTGSGSSDSCALAKARFRATVTQAREDKREAFTAARRTWLLGTSDERAARRAALAVADSRAERKKALRTYRVAVADEKAARKAAKQDARKELLNTIKAARKILRRAAKANC